MITLGKVLGGRWRVLRPFARARAQNNVLFEVEDLRVPGRIALLKTVRKTDMPSDRLYQRRCRMLEAELRNAGALVHAALPEALDAFVVEGDPALVYTPVGQGPGSFLLQHYPWVQFDGNPPNWGFARYTQHHYHRTVHNIARYMRDLALFTEDLWREGYVHANLSPEHLYILTDQVLRVTGLSGICRHQDGRIAADEPGLGNLTLGFHHAEHRRALDPDGPEDIDATRVRWHAYCLVALELLWGEDTRAWCEARDLQELPFDPGFQQSLLAYYGSWVRDHLRPLLSLVAQVLGGRDPLPDTLGAQFERVWNALDDHTLVQGFRIRPEEANGRRERWEKENAHHLEREWVVMREEEVFGGVNGAESRYWAARLMPTTRKQELFEGPLSASPIHKLFLPGDRIPAAALRDCLRPSGWAWDSGRNRLQELEDKVVRGLSLGRRERGAHWPVGGWPAALVDLDGFLTPMPVGPAADTDYVVFPSTGRFDRYIVRNQSVRPRIAGASLVPIGPPRPKEGMSAVVEVRAVRPTNNGQMAFFDFPIGDSHHVMCVLPSGQWASAVEPGMEIPVKITRVEDKVWLQWDRARGGDLPAVGATYDAYIERMERNPVVRFGPNGRYLGHVAEGSIWWGCPLFTRDRREPVPVRVRGVEVLSNGAVRAQLDWAEEPPKPMPDLKALFAGRVLNGVVTRHVRDGCLIRLDAPGPPHVEVLGYLGTSRMMKAEQYRFAEVYPLDRPVRVRVLEVDADRRRIELARDYTQ